MQQVLLPSFDGFNLWFTFACHAILCRLGSMELLQVTLGHMDSHTYVAWRGTTRSNWVEELAKQQDYMYSTFQNFDESLMGGVQLQTAHGKATRFPTPRSCGKKVMLWFEDGGWLRTGKPNADVTHAGGGNDLMFRELCLHRAFGRFHTKMSYIYNKFTTVKKRKMIKLPQWHLLQTPDHGMDKEDVDNLRTFMEVTGVESQEVGRYHMNRHGWVLERAVARYFDDTRRTTAKKKSSDSDSTTSVHHPNTGGTTKVRTNKRKRANSNVNGNETATMREDELSVFMEVASRLASLQLQVFPPDLLHPPHAHGDPHAKYNDNRMPMWLLILLAGVKNIPVQDAIRETCNVITFEDMRLDWAWFHDAVCGAPGSSTNFAYCTGVTYFCKQQLVLYEVMSEMSASPDIRTAKCVPVIHANTVFTDYIKAVDTTWLQLHGRPLDASDVVQGRAYVTACEHIIDLQEAVLTRTGPYTCARIARAILHAFGFVEEWGDVTVAELAAVSADQCRFWDLFPSHMLVADIQRAHGGHVEYLSMWYCVSFQDDK